jgi:probable F420-dependent oxidoreductase
MNSRLRIGVQLPEVERVVRWPDYVAMARAAEESGFDSIWIGDHLLYRGDEATGAPERAPWEAWTLLAALAAATDRVSLGPLVACAGFHPATLIAKMASTVDEISGGRFVLGLGAGWNRLEFDAFGIPFDRRVARFESSYQIIRSLVRGERVTASDEFVAVSDAVLLPTSTRPTPIPIMVGSNGSRVLHATLPTADIWNTWFTEGQNTPDGFAQLNDRVSEIARSVGRPPGEIQRSVCVLVGTGVGTGDGGGHRTNAPGITPVTGSLDQIAARLREFADAGADEVILVLDPIDEASIRFLAPLIAAATIHPESPAG